MPLTPTAMPVETPSATTQATAAETTAPGTPSTSGLSSYTPGDIIFSDDFSGTTKYLATGSQVGFGTTEYAQGAFGLRADPRDGFLNYVGAGTNEACQGDGCSMPDVTHENISSAVIDVDAVQGDGPTDAPYGVACDYTGTSTIDHFVGFTITSDGHQYAIVYTYWPNDNHQTVQLVGGAQYSDIAPSIHTGLNQVNHLRAVCGRNALAFYVNDVLVASDALTQPLDTTNAGVALIGAPGKDKSAAFGFVNLVVSEAPTDPTVDKSSYNEFVDLLESPSDYWDVGGNAGQYQASFSNGSYQIAVKAGNIISEAPNIYVPRANQSVTALVGYLDGPPSSSAGIDCRASGDGNYRLRVDPTGAFSVSKTVKGTTTKLVDWGDPAPSANTGTNQGNYLQLDCVGTQITAYINQVQVASVTDSDVTFGNGELNATAESDGDATYAFNFFGIDHPAAP